MVKLESLAAAKNESGNFDFTFVLNLEGEGLRPRQARVIVTVEKTDGETLAAFRTRVKPILQAAVDARRAETAVEVADRQAATTRREAILAGAEAMVGELT